MTIRKQSLGFKRITGNYTQKKGNKLILTNHSVYSSATPDTSYVRWSGPRSGSITVEGESLAPVEVTGLSGYQNPTRVVSTNYVGNIITTSSDTGSPVKLLLVGGGGGGGNPRGNGAGGRGGGGGYAYTASQPLNVGNYPIVAGAGGVAASCSNQAGSGGSRSTAFGRIAGSGGGGMSEHNGNCNGCWPGGAPSTTLPSHANGAGGGCNFGASAVDRSITLDITGSPFVYGPNASGVGGGSNGSGKPGVVIIQFTNSTFVQVVE